MGRGTSFDSISLDAMRTEVRTLLINVLVGFPTIKLSIEKLRMTHDAANKPRTSSESEEDMSTISLPSVTMSAATNAKGRPIAWMMISQLSLSPLRDDFGFKQAGRRQPQHLFILLKQLGL